MTSLLLLLLLPFVVLCKPVQFAFQQPGSSDPSDKPYRPLPWGEINILHTTDTHGWMGGHAATGSEASFSGDWGDLYSFVSRMKDEAKRRNVDLLLVDSGDRVDGNGLVDAEPPPAVKGSSAMRIWREMPYDLVTTGNHELYRYEAAKMTRALLADHYGERYVTSNVNLTSDDGTAPAPLGRLFRKFKTEQGKRVTAFGILFDFKAHAPGIFIDKPTAMIRRSWFQEAIADRPDFFLLAGHMSIRLGDSEWTQVVQAIREKHPTTPVLIFGGHHHIRDCVQEDRYSMSLASGRYMETIGFMSVSNLTGEPSFARRYIDQNRNSYAYHAGDAFDTRKGRSISRELSALSAAFNLTLTYGFAPHSYYLSRHHFTSARSIFHLMTSEILPALVVRPDRPHRHMVVLNTGSIRFDVFKGPFTRNDQWIMLPFTNHFLFVSGVRVKTAKKLLTYLNIVGEHGFASSASLSDTVEKAMARDDASVEHVYRSTLAQAYDQFAHPDSSRHLTLGYVTTDACPGKGDDTLHKPFPHVAQPIFVATALGDSSRPADVAHDDEQIDVVFLDFIKPDILNALNKLQRDRTFTDKDVGMYVDTVSANTLMQTFAEKYWN